MMDTIMKQKVAPKETTLISREELIKQYLEVRQHTETLCKPLEIEDFAVQPSSEVSPPKWHLAHTTWFFEEMILVKYEPSYTRFNAQYSELFNSYYKAAGKHWLQSDRGYLSRPTISEIFKYRDHVDNRLLSFLNNSNELSQIHILVETGLHHEKQHQELLLMDIKYILGANPLLPSYELEAHSKNKKEKETWIPFKEGIYEVGHTGNSFSYDNEGPRHKTYIHSFSICENTVTNKAYLNFIESGGYTKPELWLSQGWDWLNNNDISKPLYWTKEGHRWVEYTLSGLQDLDLNQAVTHISYFEADAYANWTGQRLPTEEETEIFLESNSEKNKAGEVWTWTKSHYSAYPGFKKFEGLLYNGNFMCNQFVLKGGCSVSPKGHYRHTYRNFYQAHQRWMFSGIRLAKDKK
ncbi:ergothioneine biosynthesis protein EgtB [Candidatus Marinamargulisbacteria bacterium SCGC AAA071-K20]|nr:ergothioneine biosynthesis protein EgtB [Candidatus Marinamargulisbacteria bacterium SCGC AAA071-K20]